ncbi:MAG: ADP-ribosylglycohydrolase family protein [Pirellulaceae bacterium]
MNRTVWLRSAFATIAMTIAPLGLSLASAVEPPKITLNQQEFRDRVYACWLGKNIGGTLGMPVEGQPGPHQMTFYTNVGAGEPAANDDLDLQILWLKALEENEGRVDARILGEYWLKYVPVDWNEYGVGKRNMRRGLLPPLSGQFENAQWKHSNGAWCRTEIWAVLAPGCPGLAAQMAWEDACVDHGNGEGTWAAVFLTAIEIAAFVESDQAKLIDLGLAMIPPDSRLAKAIRTVVAAHHAGKDCQTARQEVIEVTTDTGWFQAPRDLAFTMLAWLYGRGDFGVSLCLAVNCGDDTDTSGAAIGSLLGILHGTAGIPEKWRAPIGTKIKNVAISGFEPPREIGEFTDRTVAMTQRVLAMHQAPVAISASPTDLSRLAELTLVDAAVARDLWQRSPYQVVWNTPGLHATLDYLDDSWIVAGQPRRLKLTLRNPSLSETAYHVVLRGLPDGWQAAGLPTTPVVLAGNAAATIDFSLFMPADETEDAQLLIEVSNGPSPIAIPLTLILKSGVGSDDLALAAKGATATADSEYEQERPCTAEVIDGILATPEDFSNRWHSSLTVPHPHWIEVRLPKPEPIDRVVIRFADSTGHPVDFHAVVRPVGAAEWQEVFRATNNQDLRSYRTRIVPVLTDTFRLVIDRSVNPVSQNAAQISEIELYPAKKSE